MINKPSQRWAAAALLAAVAGVAACVHSPANPASNSSAPAAARTATSDDVPQCPYQMKRQAAEAQVAAIAPQPGVPALTQMNDAKAAYQQGRFGIAAARWMEAAGKFQRQDEAASRIEALSNAAAAYQGLGSDDVAIELLEQALAAAEKTGDLSRAMVLHCNLGAVHSGFRRPEKAVPHLEAALALSKTLGDASLAARALNNLANTRSLLGQFEQAQATYEQCIAAAGKAQDPLLATKARVNAAWSAGKMRNWPAARQNVLAAQLELAALPASHAKAYLQINVARVLDRMAEAGQGEVRDAAAAYRTAAATADETNTPAAAAHAWTYLAALQERSGSLDAALASARKGAFAAQQAQDPSALYLADWRVGHILHRQGQNAPARAAYARAVTTLQSIRQDVSASYSSRDLGVSFREGVGDVYFEYADLLLRAADETGDDALRQQTLRSARDAVEMLKSVELEDYFQDRCVAFAKPRQTDLEAVAPHTAVVYFIPLADRLEILVAGAGGVKRHPVAVRREQLTQAVAAFRAALVDRSANRYFKPGKQLYQWLIAPFEAEAKDAGIETLVFVPDGPLRTIPMAALYDGKAFLIEKFALAATPGLQLTDPKPMDRSKTEVLLAGLSESVQGFPPLEGVRQEITQIGQQFPSKTLLDKEFVSGELSREIARPGRGIVHIASHGEFNRDVRQSFVLLHDTKLTLQDLRKSIAPRLFAGHPVELLTLSACETAVGDDRAALGLAGIAVTSGARSAVATLWCVDDAATVNLMADFYRELRENPNATKATAMQKSQIKFVNDQLYYHPGFWSPYLLIGNWL